MLKELIYELIAKRDHVTFVELSRIDGFAGDLSFEYPGNFIIWVGMSDEAWTAIRDLLNEKRIKFSPTVPLTYMIDGGVLKFPIAKRRPAKGYKEPHWLPVCMRPYDAS